MKTVFFFFYKIGPLNSKRPYGKRKARVMKLVFINTFNVYK